MDTDLDTDLTAAELIDIMQERGYRDREILEELRERGYSEAEIRAAWGV